MSTDFYVTSENNPQRFKDVVEKGDAVTYSFDFTSWQEDNSDITSATWTVESGNAAVSGAQETSGVTTALVTFASAGRSLISITAATGTQTKKVFLEALAKDQVLLADDYGVCV